MLSSISPRTLRLAAIGLCGAIGALGIPGEVVACSRCLGSSGESVLSTYLWTAAALSILPLGIVGTLVIVLRLQFRRHGSFEPPPGHNGQRTPS